MSPKKCPSNDKLYCKSIAKSIADIIRYSLDDEFRKKCFELFQVSSTNETEREIKNKLLSLTQCRKAGFQKSKTTNQSVSENFFQKRHEEKENTDTKCGNDEEVKDAGTVATSTATGSDSQFAHGNIFKRNWMEISSQQYRELIKRKKLNYHSQPYLGQGHLSDVDFYSCRTNFSDSQPSSSSSSLFSDGILSSSQPLSDSANFFKEKFRESFKANNQKYFRKNLKSHRLTETSQLTRKFSY